MTSQYEERYSHPAEDGRPAVHLVTHLRDVRNRVDMVVPDDATTSAGESLAGVIRRLALVHDFGKATTWFQQYIGVLRGKPEYQRLRYHAPIGSFAAYYVLSETGHSTATCLAGLVAVAKHHGRLPRVVEYVHELTNGDDSERLSAIRHQVGDIDKHSEELAMAVFTEATGNENAWKEFANSCVDDSLFTEIADLVTGYDNQELTDPTFLSEEFYGLVLECWGTLVLADKTSAAGAPSKHSVYEGKSPTTQTLFDHVGVLEENSDSDPNGTRTEQLNHFRSRARCDVLRGVPALVESDSSVATITLPTGMGKTLTGLSAAFEIRDRTEAERVVYALPFTSIIDQVAAEVREVFETDGTDGLLALHHHLADTQISGADPTDEEQNYDAADWNDDVAGMLGESWRAGLTVTTFVQLFESLAGPRNTQSMKIPAIRGSVVVLDEPQSLPLHWWKLVPRLVTMLTEQYDATVIAMTATQPELFDGAMSLVDDVDEYFAVAERVRYRLHPSVERRLDGEETPLDYETAADELVDDAADGTSILAICNTIDSARRLTDAVTGPVDGVNLAERYFETLGDGVDDPVAATVDEVQAASGPAFVHLSTRIRPIDRLALIRIIKRLREIDVQVVAVTTQLVEAGVDISFEAVYRDLAPVDSIVQAAGRCNRSFQQEYGEVTVWWLAQPDEQRHTPAVAVYDRNGPALTPVTAAALDSVRDGETEMTGRVVARDAVEEYYRRLDVDKDVGRSKYVDFVDTADGESLGRLSLIQNRRAIDVIVCYTDADERLVDDLVAAYEEYDFERINELINYTKPLRVSIPIYSNGSSEEDAVTNLPPLAGREEEAEIRVLRPTNAKFEDYFDPTTGFLIHEETVEDRFL